jgi:hypothetical protein
MNFADRCKLLALRHGRPALAGVGGALRPVATEAARDGAFGNKIAR